MDHPTAAPPPQSAGQVPSPQWIACGKFGERCCSFGGACPNRSCDFAHPTTWQHLRPPKPSLTVSGGAPKAIAPHAFKLDPTKAWDIVRTARGDARKLLLSDFDGARPKREGTVRFVCISDTHSCESKTMAATTSLETIPDGDVLLHCGDFSNVGRPEEIATFAKWFAKLPHARKIIIAGNHDLSLDVDSYASTARRFGHGQVDDVAGTCARVRALIEAIPNCTYLQDSHTEVEGIRIWGSPWQPEFCAWAFNLPRGEPCRAKWRLIPQDTDVVLTHGPPLGHGDLTSSGVRAGCLDLLDELQTRVRPQFHCFGHIHEGYGVSTDGTTTYVNASTCNLQYRPVQKAIVFDVEIPSRPRDTISMTISPAPPAPPVPAQGGNGEEAAGAVEDSSSIQIQEQMDLS